MAEGAGAALPQIDAPTRAAWRSWLEANHASSGSAWLVLTKKAAQTPDQAALTAAEASEEALCFGWIDSLPRKLDATRSLLLMSPRKAGSLWSAVNKAHAERLIAAGQMTPAGLAKIDAAKADGAWTALDSVEALTVPDDLGKAFARFSGSAEKFDAFPRSAKRGILEWILQARTEATRAKRVEETARLAADGRRANQWPRE